MFTISSKTDLQLTWKIEFQMPYNVNTSWFKQLWNAHLILALPWLWRLAIFVLTHAVFLSQSVYIHSPLFVLCQCMWMLAVWLFFILFIFLFKYHISQCFFFWTQFTYLVLGLWICLNLPSMPVLFSFCKLWKCCYLTASWCSSYCLCGGSDKDEQIMLI